MSANKKVLRSSEVFTVAASEDAVNFDSTADVNVVQPHFRSHGKGKGFGGKGKGRGKGGFNIPSNRSDHKEKNDQADNAKDRYHRTNNQTRSKCFLCEQQGHLVSSCPLKKQLEELKRGISIESKTASCQVVQCLSVRGETQMNPDIICMQPRVCCIHVSTPKSPASATIDDVFFATTAQAAI